MEKKLTPPSLSQCPSCKAPLKPDETQCPQCGIIFSKWKDPAQRAAELRLTALAAESSRGLPMWVYVALALLIGVPLLFLFVPDVQVPALGARLRYHLKVGETLKHQAQSTLTVMEAQAPAENIETSLTTIIEVKESDSGENGTLNKSVAQLSLTPLINGRPPMEKPGSEISSWTRRLLLSSRGHALSTMGTVANQMATNVQNVKNLNTMRVEQQQQRAEYAWKDHNEPHQPPPAEFHDAYDTILKNISLFDLAYLDRALGFEWPADRVRPGFSWQQNASATVFSQWFTAAWSQPISITVQGFERNAHGYMVVLTWDSPISMKFSNAVDRFEPLSRGDAVPAVLRGKAWVRYKDGVLERLEEELTIAPSNPPTNIKITTTISRI